MKNIRILIAGAAALLALAACSKEEEPEENQNQNQTQDEPVVNTQTASVSSDSEFFTSDDNGGTIAFGAEGGQVVLTVDCWTDWTVAEDGADWLDVDASVSAGTLTVTAGQSTSEDEFSATLTLATSDEGTVFATIYVSQSSYTHPQIGVGDVSWHAPAVGELSTTIAIEASDEWEVGEVSETWLSAEKTDDGLLLTAEENEDTEERTAEVTVVCTDGVTSDTQTVTVLQDARAYITASVESLSFGASEGSAELTVESNYEWTASSSASWAEVTVSEDAVTVTVTENQTSDTREAVLTFSAGDGAENTAETQVTVSQEGADLTSLIFEFTISSDGQTVKIPLTGYVDCTVNWGDGSEAEAHTDSLFTHTYASAGVYNVTVGGTVTAVSCNSFAAGEAAHITAVNQWGTTGLTNLFKALSGSAVKTIAADTQGSFTAVTGMGYFCNECESLESVPAGLFTYASNVLDASYSFNGCTALKTLPEKMFNGATAVTKLGYAFAGCTALTSIPSDLFESCSAVTTATYCFNGCTGLTSIPEEILKPLTSATTLAFFFDGCTGITSIPSGLFNNMSTTVTSISDFFEECTGINSGIPSGLLDNCANVTNMQKLFYNCSGITSIPTGLLDKCQALATVNSNQGITYLFDGCSSITEIPAGLFDNLPTTVTGMNYVFQNCSGIKEIPEGLFDKCTSVKTLTDTFYGTGITTVPSGIFDNLTSLTNVSYIFTNCTSLKSLPDGLFAKNTKITTISYLCQGCTSLEAIPSDLFNSISTSTTQCYNLFRDCTSLKEIPSGLFNHLTKVSGFNYCFYGCTGLTEIPEELFAKNTGATSITFSYTFQNCTGLTSIPTGLFDSTTKATNFQYTFAGCTNLTGESPYTAVTLKSDSSVVNVHLYERQDYTSSSTSTPYFSKPSSKTGCFSGCTGLSDYDAITTAGWN